jgi:hypothetical protein
VVTSVLVLGLSTATPALAASSTVTTPTLLTGTTTLSSVALSATTLAGITGSASLDTTLDWSQAASVATTFDPNLVRQGRALDPVNQYARTSPGSMSSAWTLNNISLAWDVLSVNLGSIGIPASGPCDLKASGANYTCTLSSAQIDLVPLAPLPGLPYVKGDLTAAVTVTPQALATLRTVTFGGNPGGTANLALGEGPDTDPLAILCTVGVGDNLSYSLGQLASTPGVSMTTSFGVEVGVSIPNPVFLINPFADPTVPLAFASTSFPLDTTTGSIAMTGAGGTADMGGVLKNNIPPVLTAASSYTGDEGSPITLAASATGPCAAGSSYRWTFSDGGLAFGTSPKHTFTDSGDYTGTVTVTDTTGLTATKDFTVTVANLPPAVGVTPGSPTVAWGRDLTMSAQAVDPGAQDQSTLTYEWNFADSTPVVTGSATQTHHWAVPSALGYAASVKVCDKDGGCTTKAFTVGVRKRTTSLAYTGQSTGTYSAPTTLSASLMDEYGQPVNAASVDFTLGAASAGSALTGAGTATRNVTVLLPAGVSTAKAAFVGDALYEAATEASSVYTVAAMGTSLVYTGSVFGSPNKSVALSARLVDALGRPLDAMGVTFKLGSQPGASGLTTNASGVVASTLVLTQKPGIYPLTTSFAGVPGNYAPATDSRSFSLNKK